MCLTVQKIRQGKDVIDTNSVKPSLSAIIRGKFSAMISYPVEQHAGPNLSIIFPVCVPTVDQCSNSTSLQA